MEESTLTNKTRTKWIDISKGFAMLLVIIGHCSYAPDYLKSWLYSFHMPLFFILSGIVLSIDKYNFKEYFKKKVQSILIPYFLLSFLLFTWQRVFQNADNLASKSTLKKFIGIFVAQRGEDLYFSLWFLLALFLAEIAMFAIVKLLKKPLFILISTIAFAVLGYFICANIDKGLYWSIDLVPLAIVFLSIGYLLKTVDINKYIFSPFLIPVYLAINILSNNANIDFCGKLARTDMYYHNIGNGFLFFIAAITGSFAFISLSQLIKHNKILEFIGMNSIIFYTFNKVGIKYGASIMKEFSSVFKFLSNEYIMLISILVIACIFIAIVSQCITKVYPFIIGKNIDLNKRK